MSFQMIIKKVRYVLESPFVAFGLIFFRCFQVQKASAIAAKIAKFVGKKIAVHKLASDNISSAMPYFSKQQKEKILDEMWDNLGRVVGEFPHISKMSPVEVKEFCVLDSEFRQKIDEIRSLKSGAIVFSAHFGNWEIGPKLLTSLGFKVNVVYRPMNNKLVEKMTAGLRGVAMIEKSAAGSRKIVEALKRGELVLIMADQRVGDGAWVKFFHKKAITTTSIARLAIKHKIPIIPACMIRVANEFKFLARIENFIKVDPEAVAINSNKEIIRLTLEINRQIERWITEHPAQWFWVHNRWK